MNALKHSSMDQLVKFFLSDWSIKFEVFVSSELRPKLQKFQRSSNQFERPIIILIVPKLS